MTHEMQGIDAGDRKAAEITDAMLSSGLSCKLGEFQARVDHGASSLTPGGGLRY